MLINKDKLSLISNKYIFKSIFYHLNYNSLLKLFKNNKAIQNKLGITLSASPIKKMNFSEGGTKKYNTVNLNFFKISNLYKYIS